MSFGSQYNLNQRITYLEYLFQHLPPFPPISTLAQVLTAGNIANLPIDMSGNALTNVSSLSGESFTPMNLISTDAINLISSDDTNITSAASVNLTSFDNITLGATHGNINLNSPLGNVYINGAVYPPTSVPNATKADTLSIASSSSNIDYPMVFGINTSGVLTAYDNSSLTYNPSQNLLGINWPSGLQRSYLSSTNMRVGSSVGVVGNTESFCNLYAGGGSFESYSLNASYGTSMLQLTNRNSTATINQGIPSIILNKNGRSPLLNDKVGQIFFASNNGSGGFIDIANITGVVSNNVAPISGQIDFNANNAATPNLMFRMDGNLLKNTSYKPLDMNNQTISNASTVTATTFSGQYTLATASGNTEFSLILASSSSGAQSLKGSPSDLTYNPSTQILTVKNMNVSGNENQTGVITTNVLKTDIMLQQVSYFSTQTLTIATVTDLKAYGTFFMSQYDSGSIIANSIVTINLPALPTDGSLDGYTFQLRKLRGGVNQTTQNWIVNTSGGAYLIPNGNTLNAGSGGTNSTSNLNSFTQRYTIVTYSGVGYYIGCAT
jgi:hypothetical protein